MVHRGMRPISGPVSLLTLACYLSSFLPRSALAHDDIAQKRLEAEMARVADLGDESAPRIAPNAPPGGRLDEVLRTGVPEAGKESAPARRTSITWDDVAEAIGKPEKPSSISTAGGMVETSSRALTNLTALPGGALAGDAPSKRAPAGPQLSLPQGAGKVRGMGESFSADLSTGIARYQIPFELPAARGAAQPSLALSYSSSGGHGLAGVGWGIAVPTITRQIDRGTPKYRDPAPGGAWHPEQDRFIAGTDELVPICLVTGTTCAGAAPGEGMPAWSSGWQYFRARVEGSFVRYFWSPDHRTWRVQAKSGISMEFGLPLDGSGDSSGVEVDPGAATRIYSWHLIRMYDTMGDANPSGAQSPRPVNIVRYKYETSEGTTYLADIFDTPPAANAADAQVQSYAHHTHLRYEIRPDPTTSYRRGWPARVTQRLQGVDVTSYDFVPNGAARRLVRRYHLSYDQTSHVSLLANVQVEGRCSESIGEAGSEALLPATSCPRLPAVTFGYQHVAPFGIDGSATTPDLPGYEGFDERLHNMNGSPPHSITGALTELADIDSDGLPDVVVTDPASYSGSHGVFFNKGSHFAPAETMAVEGVLGADSNIIKFSNPNLSSHDVDGDGTVNLLHMPLVKTYSIYAPRQKSSGAWSWQGRVVTTASQQSPKIDFAGRNADTRLMDVNADGLVDVVYTSSTEVQTFLSLGRYPNGDGQYGNASWTSQSTASISNEPLTSCIPWSAAPIRFSDPDVRVADMNGDGLPDIVRVRHDDIRYWPGRGNGFWGVGIPESCPAGHFGEDQHVAMVNGPPLGLVAGDPLLLDDVNGDGFADLVRVRFNAIDIYLNADGAGWTDRHVILNAPPNSTISNRVRLVDINGSGTPDILWGDGFGYKYVDLAGGKRPWLLTHVESGLGRTTELEYSSSVEQMLAAEQAGHPWSGTAPSIAHVVTRVTERDNLERVGRPAGNYVTEYAYRDAVYEGRQHAFRGFRTVRVKEVGDENSPTAFTESTFLLGECVDEPGSTGLCSVTERWRDNPREALRGQPVIVETFDANNVYLSSIHTTYRLRHLYTGLDGREVRHAFVASKDTYRYDTSSFAPSPSTVALSDVELERTPSLITPDSTRALTLRSSAGRAHLRQSVSVDRFGNAVDQIDYGCIEGCAVVDEAITAHSTPTTLTGDTSAWLWRTFESWVAGSNSPSIRRNNMRHAYDARGLLYLDRINLSGTLPLDRFHAIHNGEVAPPPPSAISDGSHILYTYLFDEFGNQSFAYGRGGHCSTTRFDSAFAQLIVEKLQHTGYSTASSPCGPYSLNSRVEYDRGLGVETKQIGPNNETTVIEFDEFGRTSAVYLPNPSVPGTASTLPSVWFRYYLPSDGIRPYLIILAQTQTGIIPSAEAYKASWTYVDGFGRTLLSLEGADLSAGDAGDWIASGLTDHDARGAVSRTYLSSFYSGSPIAYPLGTPPAVASSRARYDAFGRGLETYGLDGAIATRNVYHAMETDTWDAADLEPGGAHASTPSTARTDGHGRRTATIERVRLGAQIESVTTSTSYAPSGEPVVISRSRPGAPAIVRWMQYDSFGHMVLNVDPSTTKNFSADPSTGPGSMKAWRYAYDLLGQLVGTSDPRGCGKNIYYLSDGRVLGEDYSPCKAEHSDYSPPNLTVDPAAPGQASVDGDGLEVLFRYDAADPEEAIVPDFPAASGSGVAGYMTSASERASKTIFHRDFRGRLTAIARKLAKPGASEAVIADRYAAHWYVQKARYDEANRVIQESTGADVPEVMGEGGYSDVTTRYSRRGTIERVSSSYGSLIGGTTRDADGLITQIKYGDVAGTSTEFEYDVRRRLDTVVTRRGPPALWTANPSVYTAAGNPPAGPSVVQSVLEHYSFEYDAVDNPTTIIDFRDLGAWPTSFKPSSRQFQYDDLYRLTRVDYLGVDPWQSPFAAENADPTSEATPMPHVSFPNRVTSQTFAYDAFGNTSASDDDSHGFYDRSLGTIVNGAPSSGPYQLKHASHASGGPRDGEVSAAYDDGGNLTSLALRRNGPCLPTGAVCSQRFAYEWDEIGQLTRARRWDMSTPGVATDPLPTGATAAELRYAYTEGQRVLKTAVDSGGNQLHTLYVFGSLELRRARFLADDYERTAATVVPYLFAAGVRLARVYYAETDVPTLSSGHLHVLFELPDHLGSSSFVIDQATSELVEATRYQAYGATESDYRPERWKAYRDDYRFTGKEDDIEVGLTYFGARFYSPNLNRWISPDPLALHEPGQADLNLYAYVHGRVLVAVDLFGLDDDSNVGGRILGGIQAAGGFLEAALAISAAVTACAATVGGACAPAVALAVAASIHGADNMLAGFRTASTGVPTQTYTERSISGGWQSLNPGDEETGNLLGGLGNLAIGLGIAHGTIAVSPAKPARDVAQAARQYKGLEKVAEQAPAAEESLEAATNAQAAKSPTQASGAGGLPTLQEAAANPATGRVATRINLAYGRTRFTPLRPSTGKPVSAGWEHVLDGHFNKPVSANRSIFTLSPDEVRGVLQSSEVVRSPVTAIEGGQFVRTVNVGRTIGISSLKNGGGPTSILKVLTDEAGNLITAYPY